METFLLLPIWAVIQWMALLHIVAACDEAGKEGAPHPIALGIQRIFVPSMLVCLTTMAGFCPSGAVICVGCRKQEARGVLGYG